MTKDLGFDLFLPKMKAQNIRRAFDILAEQSSVICGTAAAALSKVFEKKLQERTFNAGQGAVIFDATFARIQKPVLAIATLETGVNLKILEDEPVHIIAVLLSPAQQSAEHLRRLASLSRVLKNENLCEALKDVKDTDSMSVLFMPTQQWMQAA